MIQELMEMPLTRILGKHIQLPEFFINYILFEILKAVAFMHEKQRIHRDLKSDNILLDCKGRIKLADMGFAAQLTQERRVRNTIAGTPCWIAPEIINRESYGLKADIWSFGVIMIEIIEGEPPNLRKKYEDIFNTIKQGDISLSDPDSVNPNYVRMINSCIQLDCNQRKTAQELLEAPIFENIVDTDKIAEYLYSIKPI